MLDDKDEFEAAHRRIVIDDEAPPWFSILSELAQAGVFLMIVYVLVRIFFYKGVL